MLTYTQAEIKEIIKKIVGGNIHISPIGNHELNRNLVYKVTDVKQLSIVFKLYYKKNRWNREVATLRHIKNSNILIPQLLDFGILKDGIEWCIMEYIDGIPLNQAVIGLTDYEKSQLIEEMGIELGKLHSNTFNFFGNWNEYGEPLEKADNYHTLLIEKIESNMITLFQQGLPEEELHKKALEKLRGNYSIFEDVDIASLCHNDYDGRNILINKRNNKWCLTAVIDFEQSFPWDKEQDLKNLYHTLFLDNPVLEKAFLKGYCQHQALGENFDRKMKAYLLYLGLNICSWAYTQAPQYYRQGVILLKRLVMEEEGSQ